MSCECCTALALRIEALERAMRRLFVRAISRHEQRVPQQGTPLEDVHE